jgi:hypothetical protein
VEFSRNNNLPALMGPGGHPDIPGMYVGPVFYEVCQHVSSFLLTFQEEKIMGF